MLNDNRNIQICMSKRTLGGTPPRVRLLYSSLGFYYHLSHTSLEVSVVIQHTIYNQIRFLAGIAYVFKQYGRTGDRLRSRLSFPSKNSLRLFSSPFRTILRSGIISRSLITNISSSFQKIIKLYDLGLLLSIVPSNSWIWKNC